MSDPAIKLFGKTIQLPTNDDVSHEAEVAGVDCEQSSCDHNSNDNSNSKSVSCSNVSVSPANLLDKKSAFGEGSMDSKQEDTSLNAAVLEEQTPNEDKESPSPKASKKEEQSETSVSQEKPLKKPDKIIPCPRCNSMDTKFCYFNNYNVNQPRHFCKNCQRYWTAGGTMRNVPVGAGRRKNKNSCTNPRYIVIPDTSNGVTYPALRANTFGSESPLCESMTSALTIEEKSSHNAPNGFIGSDQTAMVAKAVRQESSTGGSQCMGPGVPCFPAPPWPNPWNPLPFHIPIYATPPYWSCGVPATWIQPPSVTTDVSSTSSGPSSPLGKHPREGATLKSSNKDQNKEGKRTETKVLAPKTLRFDDPSDAAKSSIWTTLGIKHENTKSLDSGVFFRGLQSKGGRISSAGETSSVLQANPAAVSRSLRYHESAE